MQTEAVVTVPDVRGVAYCCKRGRQPPSFVEVFQVVWGCFAMCESALFVLMRGDCKLPFDVESAPSTLALIPGNGGLLAVVLRIILKQVTICPIPHFGIRELPELG